MSINVTDHYWVIGGSTTELYAGVTNTLVPVADPAYVAWGQPATPISDETELAEALRANGSRLPAWLLASSSCIQPTPTTYTQEQLKKYSADARYRKATSGVIITSLSPIAFLSDPVARNTLANAYEYIKATPGSTVNWKLTDGSFVVLNEAQLDTAVTAVATYVQSCFTKESVNATSIDGGSITSLAQIDSAYASISNVFP